MDTSRQRFVALEDLDDADADPRLRHLAVPGLVGWPLLPPGAPSGSERPEDLWDPRTAYR